MPPSPPARGTQLIQAAHGATVTKLAFSAQGLLATGSQFDKTTRIWDLRRRTLLAVLQHEAFTGFFWDADREALVLVGAGEYSEQRDRGRLSPPDLLVHPDGTPIESRAGSFGDTLVRERGRMRPDKLSTDKGRHALVTATGKTYNLPIVPGTFGAPDQAAIVRDGAELVGDTGSKLAWWDLANPARPPSVQAIPGDRVDSAIAEDGSVLVAYKTDDDNIVALFTRDGTPKQIAVVGLLEDPEVEISQDGSIGVVAWNDRVVAYDLKTGKLAWTETGDEYQRDRDRGFVAGFSDVALAPDGRTLVLPRSDGTVSLRDLHSGRDLGALGHVLHNPLNVAWVDARHLMAADQGHVAIWDVTRGEIVRTYTESRGWLTATVIEGDVVVARMTNCFKSLSDAWTIAWVDRWAGIEPPADLLAGKAPVLRDGCATAGSTAWPPARGLASAPLRLGAAGEYFDARTGRSLVAVPSKFSIDGVREPDGRSTRLQHTLRSFGGKDLQIRGGFVFAKHSNGGIDVWNTSDGKHLRTISIAVTRGGAVEQKGLLLGISDDGRRIALEHSYSIEVFDTATGASLATARLPGPAGATAIAFGPSPDRAWIGTWDGAMFEVAGGQLRALGKQTGAWIEQIEPSPDGTRLVAVGADGGLRILDAGGKLAATLVEFGDDEPIAFTPSGAYRGTAEAASRIGWRFDAPVEVFRFEQFARAFDRPAVVAQRLAGGAAEVEAALVRPPTVQLQKTAQSVATSSVRLDVLASTSTGRRIDVVRAYREGREVAAASICNASGSVALDVPLLAGTNTIAVQAFDDLGFASNAATTTVVRTGGPQPALHVVAIGVGSYPALEPQFQLPLATADASAIATAFQRDVGAGKRFASLNAQVLLDRQATVPAVLGALDKLAAMQPDDLAIVLLAGHGVKPTPTDDMVFVTGTASSLQPADLRATGITWQAIGERLARARGRVIVLLDACHSGHVSQNLIVPNDQLASALSRDRRAGVIVFAAAKGRQSSYEPNGVRGFALSAESERLVAAEGDHGFFTGALLSSMRDPASDRNADGVLQMSEWIHATTERVQRATEGLQTPWVARQEMFGDFAIVRLR